MSVLRETGFPSEVEIPEKPFIFVVVVWGNEFIDKFINYALPTFLAQGNLPKVAKRRSCEFVIVTSSLDRLTIVNDKIFKELSTIMRVEFIEIDFARLQELPHLKMSFGHRLACEYVMSRNGYCVFLGPDYLLSDGSLAYLDRCAAGGARAVLLPGFRLIEEEVRATIIRDHIGCNTYAIAIDSRSMVKLILSHVHPEMKSYMVDSNSFSYCPNYVVWPLPFLDSLLVHAFHLHPLLLDLSGPQDLSTLDQDTIDGDFVGRVIDNWDDIEIVQDSDQAVVVSLTPKGQGPGVAGGAMPDPANVARWAYSTVMTPLHRHYFTKAILFHSGPLPRRSDLPLRETGQFVYAALKGPVVEPWKSIGSVAKFLYADARRRSRASVRRQVTRLRYFALGVVHIPRYGVRMGRLLERYNDQIVQLLNENKALRERLAGSMERNSHDELLRYEGEITRSGEVV